MANVVGELNNIFSEGTSAQDQSEANLNVVRSIFTGAANLSDSVSFPEDVSMLYVIYKPWPCKRCICTDIHLRVRSLIPESRRLKGYVYHK